MSLLLDTSVLIEAERRRINPDQLPIDAQESLCIASVTIAEILYGLHLARTVEQRLDRQRFFDDVLAVVTVLPFDLDAAVINAHIWSELRAGGGMIGVHDLIIAATALANDMAVVTDNVSEFSRVAGLRIIQPSW